MDGVKVLERKLGFHRRLEKFERTKQTSSEVLSLTKTIDGLTASYWSTTEATLRQSDVFRSNVNAVFDRFGHLVWPSGNRKSIEWLALAEEDDLKGDYPRDLFCHDEYDQSMSVSSMSLSKSRVDFRQITFDVVRAGDSKMSNRTCHQA